MPTGIVQGIQRRPGKSPIVNIDGQAYYSGTVDLGNMAIGDKIDFDSASKTYRGEVTWFLNGWKLLTPASRYPPLSTATPAPHPPVGGTNSGITAPEPSYAPLSEGERLTVSNWVAAAIQAGQIKDRADLGIWAKAACEAIRFAGKPVEPDEIP